MSEHQYINLLHDLFNYGEHRTTRNGTTLSLFGHHLDFNLQDGFPLLTTKKMFFKGIVTELAWFLRGCTDVTELHKDKNHIWDGNTKDREFDAGPVYGFQWRHFGAEYKDCKSDYTGKGVDQIAKLIHLIKTDPTSRRMVLSAWNPSAQEDMCLPPCHVMYQFYVKNNRLSCQMYQRSSDAFLGLPFNIASTALLTHLLAHETGLDVGNVRVVLGDLHLYETHCGVANIQMSREPYPFPKLQIKRKNLNGLWNLKYEDVELVDYQSHGRLKAEMSV
jgi:thymidylate synthase